ncbi:cytochrome P450 [Bradyrhizobium prioriisuperbiae]|uniref:cytochrome P450 n=1 Tax=Bradyrhizobium prioriisuperbiae TaxID=2854389 RepID=UPI0028E1AA82|nr:cytochrome P450 [Bradyrhizobium prioritasuperba]
MTLFDRHFLHDPYPEYALLRDTKPVMQLGSLSGKIWFVTRYEHVREVLESDSYAEYDLPAIIEAKVDRTSGRDNGELGKRLSNWLFFMSPPKHAIMKRSLAPLYALRNLDLARNAVWSYARRIVCKSTLEGPCDTIRQLASPLPVVATSTLLGISINDREHIANLASQVLRVFEPLQRMSIYESVQGGLNGLDVALSSLSHAEESLRTLARRAEASASLANLPSDELRALVIMLFAAGQDTISASIGNAVFTLAASPEYFRCLRKHPDIIPNAARELIRFDPPVQIVARVANSDQDLGGAFIRVGERVCVALGSANRDERHVPDAGTLNLERSGLAHVSFGLARHYCLGAQLALTVLEAFLTALVECASSIQFAGPYRRRSSYVFRGFAELPIKFAP